MSDTQEPLAYLLDCSKGSLESFELSKLNQAANLRKEFHELLDDWVKAEVSSRLAHWIAESDDGSLKIHVGCPHQDTNLACAVQMDLVFLPQHNLQVWETSHAANAPPCGVTTVVHARIVPISSFCMDDRSESATRLPDYACDSSNLDFPLAPVHAVSRLRALEKVALAPPETHPESGLRTSTDGLPAYLAKDRDWIWDRTSNETHPLIALARQVRPSRILPSLPGLISHRPICEAVLVTAS
jgi:hypothetical protein